MALAQGEMSVSSTDEGIWPDGEEDSNNNLESNLSESFQIRTETQKQDKEVSKGESRIQTQWEEEATPEQTAFGKELLFARKNLSVSSDVLSTASEMGTVIEYGDKLSELDAMDMGSLSPMQMYKHPQETRSFNEQLTTATTISGISMPQLDEVGHEPNNNRDTEYDEKKGSEQDEDEIGKVKALHATSALFSNAIKRIGTGIANGSRVVMSAPTTPLGASWMPQSPSPYATHASASNGTPSSFLLRSPGSKAFELASSQPTEILKPRFSSRNRGHSLGDRIDEHQPLEARPQQTAFQIARSCFSYDAYDTAMDDMFEVTMTETDNDFSGPSRRGIWIPTTLEHPPTLRASSSWDAAGVSQVLPLRSRRSRRRETNELWGADSIRGRDLSGNHVVKDTTLVPSNLHELNSSQTIEIEREDALNILACLVERGVSLKNRDEQTDQIENARELGQAERDDKASSTIGAASTTSSLVLSAVDELREMVMASKFEENKSLHERRLMALDELLRSHEYAQEMRRASQSALAWLKTVDDSAISKSRHVEHSVKREGAQSEEETIPEGLDLFTAKALLRSSQLKVKEKSDLADRLNEELAKCRAEIGRLRSSQTSTFKSPNRSILDESDDVLPEDPSQDRSFDTASTPIVAVDDSGFVDASFINEHDHPGALFDDQRVVTLEAKSISMYQKALDDANEQIRKLQAQLRDQNNGVGAPLFRDQNNSPRPLTSDHSQEKSVIDEENFETDWSQLSSGLPPPPDHGLRNPIVNAVLEQWSNDPGLHNNLLDWMEAVLEGGDASAIPPLMISNLEAHVRDGFVMHVLPQLLRRADIRVDVQTRTRRITAHDISVTVEPSDPFRSSQPLYSEDDAVSTTHSTTTSIAANGILARKRAGSTGGTKSQAPYEGISRVSYDEIAEDGIGLDQPNGLMSALGGALGGLLARRRPPHLSGLSEGSSSPLEVSPAAQNAAMHTAAAAEAFGSNQGQSVFLDEGSEDDQPYHRVVSAPAGRIGVTFVQYRGHAMVSDVAHNSPLAGWIFPSDILIAIDELPVSGMPVRDIIKILMDRKQKQRALRVISSHAMNELSLNTSLLMEAGS